MKIEDITAVEKINVQKEKDVLLTVWCLTYNHKQYIGEALDNILNQQVNFKFDIIIFDDASTDGTSQIVREYAEKYPDMIRAYILKNNTYNHSMRNVMLDTFKKENLKSKYVAICEGDDYWTDTNKLQMQVDFLEKNKDCVMTIHSAKQMNYRDKTFKEMRPFKEGYVPINQIIMETSDIIPTASSVLKLEAFLIDEEFPNCPVGDKRIWLSVIKKGKIYYFDKEMCVYRYMHNTSWSKNYMLDIRSLSEMYLKLANFYFEYDRYTKGAFKPYPIYKGLSFICGIAEEADNLTEETYCSLIRELADKFPFLKKIETSVLELYRYIYVTDYVGSELADYCSRYNNIYIYGAGCFGRKIYSALSKKNVNLCGYVVSDNSNDANVEHKIYNISQIELNKNAGIVVAVNNRYRYEIERILEKYNYNDYCAPFWINLDTVIGE